MKKFILTLLLFIVLPRINAEVIPVFDRPEANARLLAAEREMLQDTGSRKRLLITEHPLLYIHEFAGMKLPDGRTVYYRDDLVFQDNALKRLPPLPAGKIFAIIAAAVLMAALLWRNRKQQIKDWEVMLIPVLLRITLLLAAWCKWDCVFTAVTDENGYFETIRSILDNEWSKPCKFTIGTGIFYLPFILFFKASNITDIIPYFNFFSALVLAPATLALGFIILRKMEVSAKIAGTAMALWAIYPFTAFHIEDWSTLNFQHFFTLDTFFTSFERLRYYAFCINSGFNAMSDTPGLLLIMAALALLLTMPDKMHYALLFGLLYGFACLVRINYILLAPLFALMLYRKFAPGISELFRAALWSLGGFLAIFSIQFVCNTLQFGSPLTFGYILHYPDYAVLDRPAAGFTWHTFSKLTNLRYLCRVNLPLLALGTAALWLMKDKNKQDILVLLTIPLLIFFSGYSHTFCDGRRFIFPALAGMLMAVAANEDIRRDLKLYQKLELTIPLLMMITLCVPFNAHWRGLPLLLGNHSILLKTAAIAVPVLLTVAIFDLLRCRKYYAAGFVMLSAIFYFAPVELLAAGIFLLLITVLLRLLMPEKIKTALRKIVAENKLRFLQKKFDI